MNFRKLIFGLVALTTIVSGPVWAGNLSNRLGLVLYNPRVQDEAQLIVLFQRIRDTGVKRLLIPYWGCQPDIRSNEVGSCVHLDPAITVHQAQVALRQGLQVAFLPIVTTPTSDWRGFFKPTNYARWFETYGTWIKQVARDAARLGMTELVVATEFSTPIYQQTEMWKSLLRSIRAEAFKGKLIMTVNWDQPDFGFWSEADAFGISAYFPLDRGQYPTVPLLTVAIQNRELVKQRAARAGKPIYITEFGYPNLPSGAKTPSGDANDKGKPDLELQAACYDAFLKAWDGQDVISINAWATSDPTQAVEINAYEMLQRPAEAVLRRYLQPAAVSKIVGGARPYVAP